jgi:hypothetical protein
MRNKLLFYTFILFVSFCCSQARAEETLLQDINALIDSTEADESLFDDKTLIEGYARKFGEYDLNILVEMIKDDTLSPYKTAAAVRTFSQKFCMEVVGKEKSYIEKYLLRRFAHSDSPFVQMEIMYTLCRMDRYRYFESMVPALIQKLNHYNPTVNEIAYEHLNVIIETGSNRPREARIVFNTLRKIFFLSRKRLENVTEPGPSLVFKLKLMRWAVKVLGIQELERLPSEVINLL